MLDPLRRRRAVTMAGAVALVSLSAAGGCSAESDNSGAGEREHPEVTVRTVREQSASISHTYTGRTHGAREVAIRARVDGMLESREYAEGSSVNQGTTLFRIDAEPYEARVQSAEANVERARSELRQAEREWERVQELYQDNAASGRERDAAKSAVELARAEVSLAEAELAEANIDLDHTVVESPLHGFAGREEQPTGSLVKTDDLLTTVTQLDPIHVRFSIPENHIARHGWQIRSDAWVDIFVKVRGDRADEHVGRLDFTEASIDPETGTVDGRAVFPNPGNQLMPGQFVRITLAGLYAGSGFRVPHSALIDDPNERYVYVVDDEQTIEKRTIEVMADLGDDLLLTGDLEDGNRVVTGGAMGLESGDRVQIRQQGDPAVVTLDPSLLVPAYLSDHDSPGTIDEPSPIPHPGAGIVYPIPNLETPLIDITPVDDGNGADGEGADGEGADGEGADGEGADGEGAHGEGERDESRDG